MDEKHSPIPWAISDGHKGLIYCRVGKDTREVGRCGMGTDRQANANAAFIVRAANNFDALVACLKDAVAPFQGDQSPPRWVSVARAVLDRAEAV